MQLTTYQLTIGRERSPADDTLVSNNHYTLVAEKKQTISAVGHEQE